MAAMDAPATLVWIAPAPPDAAQSRAVTTWARSRGVSLAPPAPAPLPALAVDLSVADRVEELIERARDALVAHEADGVDRAISAAAALLQAHPELPQAAWLLAEVERARATRFRRLSPVDEAAADRAWARADALDGGRVAGLGEQVPTSSPPRATVTLDGVPAGAELSVDGIAREGATLDLRAGPHAVVVAWDGSPARATWFEAPPGTSTVHVDAPAPPPCSTRDLGRVHRTASDTVDASGVRCETWVAALPNAEGVSLALCEPGRCGPFAAWRAPAPWTWNPPDGPHDRTWPAWATWGLVGAGAAIATGVVIVAAGVLRTASSETRFVSGGVRTQ